MANAHRGRPAAATYFVEPNQVLNRDQVVEELETVTHRELVEETQNDDIFAWLARFGLIRNEVNCPHCNIPCRITARYRLNDGKQWTCPSQNCNYSKSIRADSFFEDAHLSLRQLVDFVYFWSRKMPLTYIKEETGIVSWTTAVDWANFIRDVCGLWYVLLMC